MQGHGRTADIKRDITYENLADDVAGLLNISGRTSGHHRLQPGRRRDLNCAIRHRTRSQSRQHLGSAPPRRLGQRGVDALNLTAEAFKARRRASTRI